MLSFKINTIDEEDIQFEETVKIGQNFEEINEIEQKTTTLIITPIDEKIEQTNIESIIRIKEIIDSDKPISPLEAQLRSEKEKTLIRSTLIAHNNYFDDVGNSSAGIRRRSSIKSKKDAKLKEAKESEKTVEATPNVLKDLIIRHGIDVDITKKAEDNISTTANVLCASCSKKLIKDTIINKERKNGCFPFNRSK